MRAAVLALLVALPPLARADGEIDLHDLANTDGEWQEGAAIVRAPRAEVQRWLTEYAAWPGRFPDVEWSEVLPDDAQGRHVIKFRSRIADAILTVHEAVAPGLLVFEGSAPYIHTQGRIHLIDLGDGTTRVLMQSTAEVHGFYKIFATKRLKRTRAYKVTRSHLTALHALAAAQER
jgi:hypothetical protein